MGTDAPSQVIYPVPNQNLIPSSSSPYTGKVQAGPNTVNLIPIAPKK